MKKSFIATFVIIAFLVVIAYHYNFFNRLSNLSSGCSSCCRHEMRSSEAEPLIIMEEATIEPMDNDMTLEDINFEEMMEIPEQPE